MEESGLEDSLNDYTYYCLIHTFPTYRLQYGMVDIRRLTKVIGVSVAYIEQHYDIATVVNMTDYITKSFNEKSKDAFEDVILRGTYLLIVLKFCLTTNKL